MDEAQNITVAIGPRIQQFFDDGMKLEAVSVGLCNVLAMSLHEAGLSKFKTQRLSKRLHKKLARHSYNKAHAAAVTETLGGIIASSGVSYLAASWSVSAALSRCMSGVAEIPPQAVEKFRADLVQLINEAAPPVAA